MFASDLRSQIASTTLLACGKGRNGITNGSGSGTIMGPTLRDYQVKGVEWMNALYLANSNGILADEMGLGKTIQVLSYLESLFHNHSISGPHLIVMPLSVISSWKGDLKRFDNNTFDVHIHHGEKNEREQCFEYWHRNLKRCMNKTPWLLKVTLVLTTYEIAMKDEHLLRGLSRGSCKWQYLVVDEAHRLKNRNSLLFDTLNRVHSSGRRLLLTGTPLQNNLSELWSLLHFILPTAFANEQEFNDLFSQPFETDSEAEEEEEEAVAATEAGHRTHRDKHHRRRQSKLFSLITMAQSKNKTNINGPEELEKKSIVYQLHELIKPYILRRVKADVALELPPKVEKIVYCPLSALQRVAYELFRTRVRTSAKSSLKNHIAEAEDDVFGPYEKALMNANNLLMQLRKLCNHPYLVLEDVQTIPDALYYQHLLSSSGKLFVLDKLLSPLLQQGSKILIFSQMTSMLDILQGYLQQRSISCARLDGSTPQHSREHQLRVFNSNSATSASNKTKHAYSSTPTDENAVTSMPAVPVKLEECGSEYSVFLLSTRAGGVGINLQAADTVILFDSDWNPQQDLQAISRAHRIGQTRPVLVLRLVSTGPDEHTYSVEQRILRRAGKKLDAERQVLANGVFDLSDSVEVGDKIGTSKCELSQGLLSREAGSAGFTWASGAAAPSPVSLQAPADSLHESMLALFETITDSESVSTDADSIISSSGGAPCRSIVTSAAQGSQRQEGGNLASLVANRGKPSSVESVVRMYHMDFSQEGIEHICRRDEPSATTTAVAGAVEGEGEGGDIPSKCSTEKQEELISLMSRYNKEVWRPWLHPQSDENTGTPYEEEQDRVKNKYATTPGKYNLRDCGYDSRSTTHRLRGKALKGAVFPTDGVSYVNISDTEQERHPIYQFGRKRKAPRCHTGRSQRALHHQRRTDGGESSEDEIGVEESDYSDTESAGELHCESPQPLQEELQEDDICALCNQAWVTPAEVQAFLDLKLQSLLKHQQGGTDTSGGAAGATGPAVSPPPPLHHDIDRSSSRDVSKSRIFDFSLVDTVTSESADDKGCVAESSSSWKETETSSAQRRGLDGRCGDRDKGGSYSRGNGIGSGSGRRSQSIDALLTLMDAKSAKSPPVPSSPSTPSPKKHTVSDMMNVMILCDGCDGSFHMICVGLDEVPQNDWYCQLCSFTLPT